MISRKVTKKTGIDISDRSIEIVEIESKGNKIKSKKFIKRDLPLDTIYKGQIKSELAFDRIFNDLLDKAEKKEFSFDHVTLSIPEEFITHAIVEIEDQKVIEEKDSKKEDKDKDNKAEKKNSKEEEVKESDKEAIEEISIEQRVLDKLKDNLLKKSAQWQYDIFEVQVKDKTQYLFIGIPKDKLEEYILHISEFGIDIDIAEPDSLSLSRNIDFSDNGNVVVDFGENKIILYFFFGGLLYKRDILKWGANKIIDELSLISKLSVEKEEKFFQRIGYGSRSNKNQKKVIGEYFAKFNKHLEKFLAEIKKDYSLDIKNIEVTGGLSKIIGLKKLLPEDISYQKVQSRILLEDKNDYINSLGSALRENENDINFLTDEISEEIKKNVEQKIKDKEKSIIEKELNNNEENEPETNKLKQAFLEKWGELPEEHQPNKWIASFKLTNIAQLLALIVVGLGFLAGLIFYTSEQKYENVRAENQDNQISDEREYITFAFPLIISTGENIINTDDASIIGRFESAVFEAKETFIIPGDEQVLTQELFDKAKFELEDKIRKGIALDSRFTLSEDELIITEAVGYEESLAASNIEVGNSADKFELTVRGQATFAIVNKDRFDIILSQRLRLNLNSNENIDNYSYSPSDYLLIEFLNEFNSSKVNVYVEAEK